jgi:hypothetical protein
MANPKKTPVVQPEYASAASVTELASAVNSILDKLEAMSNAPATPSPIQDVVVPIVGGPNKTTTNPEWESTAREILGEALDHTEVEHEKSGGIKFTVVIDRRFSNANPAYLELNKTDRRTKEVSREGMQGVEEWCRQILGNLSRTKKIGAALRA